MLQRHVAGLAKRNQGEQRCYGKMTYRAREMNLEWQLSSDRKINDIQPTKTEDNSSQICDHIAFAQVRQEYGDEPNYRSFLVQSFLLVDVFDDLCTSQAASPFRCISRS